MKNEKPSERRESSDSGADGARAREDRERVKTEYDNSKEDLKGLDFNEITHILDNLNKELDAAGEDSKTHEKIIYLLRELDQSDFMIFLRRWWDSRSSLMQKFLYNMHKYPMPGALPVFRPLVSFGFLELKNVSPEELKKMEKDELAGNETAVKVLKFFVPEVKAFGPLLKACFKLEEKRQVLAEESREFLKEKREEDEKKNAAKQRKKKAA